MTIPDDASCKSIWMEGRIVPQKEATIHVLSHSLHYGGAVFEGMRAYRNENGRGAIFRARAHFKRLENSLAVFGYSTPYSIDDYISATKACILENGLTDCYIRPIVYLDQSFRGLQLPESPQALSAIAAWDWGSYMGEEKQKQGIRVKISSHRRSDAPQDIQSAKLSGGYVTSLLARKEASIAGFDEALLLDSEGNIAEGPGENVFIVRGKKIITPPEGHILPGITRDSVMTIAKDLGYEVAMEPLQAEDLYSADEVFFSGTAVEITGIRDIDGKKIGTGFCGPVTQKLAQAYFDCVRGKSQKYRDWLTPLE